MIFMRPQLKHTVPLVLPLRKFKPLHHPIAAALLRLLQQRQQLVCRKLFKVPHNIRQAKWFFCPGNEMNMIGHNHIAIQRQPFVFPAIIETVYNDLFVFISCKNIYPLYNLKCKKVELILIVDLIALAHG